MARAGYAVTALDIRLDALRTLRASADAEHLSIHTACVDLTHQPLPHDRYDLIVVTRYLDRTLFPALQAALREGGLLLYETFMLGNERFGKPSNPEFLLRSHELIERVAGACTILAYEQGEVSEPKPAVIQRICAVKGHNPVVRLP